MDELTTDALEEAVAWLRGDDDLNEPNVGPRSRKAIDVVLAHLDSLAHSGAEARGRIEELEKAAAGFMEQVDHYMRWSGGQLPPDHACVECRPASEMIVTGFQCSLHKLRALLLPQLEDSPDE